MSTVVVERALAGALGSTPGREVAPARAMPRRALSAAGDASAREGSSKPTVPVTSSLLLARVGARSGPTIKAVRCAATQVPASAGAGAVLAAAYPRPREVGEVRRVQPVGASSAS